MPETKPRVGRPPFPGKWKRRHFYMSEQLYKRLGRIGVGSPSAGLRLLVERYDKLRAKAKKERPKAGGPPPSAPQPRTALSVDGAAYKG